MSDETLTDDEPTIEWSSASAEYVPCNTCIMVAPSGWEAFAEATGALLVRVQSKNGDVEVLTDIGKSWHTAGKALRDGSVVSLPTGK